MAATVDARGLSCPQPVIMILDEIKNGDDPEIIILVDTDTSKENVTRAASGQGAAMATAVPTPAFRKSRRRVLCMGSSYL